MKKNLPQRLKTGVLLLLLLIGSFAFGQTTVSYDFSDGGAVAGLDEAHPGITLDANIGFGSFKNGGTANPTINGGQLRLYQNTTKGGSIKIYASNGVTITKVVVYASGTDGRGPAGYTVDGGTGSNLSISGGKYTMSDVFATSFVEFYSKGTSNTTRVYVDKFEVTYISGGNTGPEITNIIQAPDANVVPSETVLVSANITDGDGVASAKLYWGTASGSLPNEIIMSDLGGGEYYTDTEILGQADGTTVYYEIVAIDSNAIPKTTTSPVQSYTVTDPFPGITNITQDPTAGNVTDLDDVLVTADITTPRGTISGATLNWGTASGSLSNTVTMLLDSGNTYFTEISAQAEGTIVYYEIVAINSYTNTTTSAEQNYTVTAPAFPFPYCGPLAFSTVEPITLVNVAGINNVTSATVNGTIAHEDFTGIEGEMEKLGSYTITLKGNTAGNFDNRFMVYIDWNQDGDFDDIDEAYNITTILKNSTGLDSKEVTWTIDVPSHAVVGSTRMRVKKTYGTSAYPDPCVTGTNYGQAEDYTINVTVGVPRPVIANIAQDPSGTVNSAEAVSVSADITDETGIASAKLRWGTVSGTLTNDIAMILGSGDNYSAVIPAQADGTTVYYEIEAIDTDAVPNTTVSPEQSYRVSDFCGGFENFDNAVLPTSYDNGSFVGNNGVTWTYVASRDENGDDNNSGIDGNALMLRRIADGSKITSSAFPGGISDFSVKLYKGFTGGGDRQVELFVNGVSYGLSDAFDDFSEHIFTVTGIDVPGDVIIEIRNATSRQIIVDDITWSCAEAPIDGYVYDNGWSPSDPSGIATASDNIRVLSGIASLTENTTANNITINTGATLNIEKVLTIAGDITIDGDLVFVSSATGNGELAAVPSTSTITGQATVQSYMSNNRSYRMVSSSVTTSGSIHNNWQEGAISNLDNPNPGFGTHITGSTIDQTNGFDGTVTGAPSMFTVDPNLQSFVVVPNTDVKTLVAGDAYLLFVRGDRSIDLGSNSSVSETVLRAKGTLHTGYHAVAQATPEADSFAMFGNPYQSAVDINSAFGRSDNVNTEHYYVYDPSLGTYGTYVTVNLPDGTNTSDSAANQYLQPGQAAQFSNFQIGSSAVFFEEEDKAPGNFTATSAMGNRLSSDNMLTVQLYTTENFNNGGKTHDSFGIIFGDGFDNEVTHTDALKPMNFYENLGRDHNGTYLSIERREMPGDAEVYPLYSSGYNYTDYTLKMKIDGLDDSIFYLDDHFTQTSTLLDGRETAYNFTVDKNDPLSIDTGRFAIRTEARLDVNDNNMLAGIRLYPNPLNDNTFYINAPNLNGKQLDVNINDLSGRVIYKAALDCQNNMVVVPMKMDIASGIYLVTLNHGGESHTIRLIKE
jgi:hypothetical protein